MPIPLIGRCVQCPQRTPCFVKEKTNGIFLFKAQKDGMCFFCFCFLIKLRIRSVAAVVCLVDYPKCDVSLMSWALCSGRSIAGVFKEEGRFLESHCSELNLNGLSLIAGKVPLFTNSGTAEGFPENPCKTVYAI